MKRKANWITNKLLQLAGVRIKATCSGCLGWEYCGNYPDIGWLCEDCQQLFLKAGIKSEQQKHHEKKT